MGSDDFIDNGPNGQVGAYTPQQGNAPHTALSPDGLRPYWIGGTFAVNATLTNVINAQISVGQIAIHEISILPLSSTYSVSFFYTFGSFSVGSAAAPLTIQGAAYDKDWGPINRYPIVSSGDSIIVGVLSSSASAYVTISIDGEYL